jgi:hypothetical protein
VLEDLVQQGDLVVGVSPRESLLPHLSIAPTLDARRADRLDPELAEVWNQVRVQA